MVAMPDKEDWQIGEPCRIVRLDKSAKNLEGVIISITPLKAKVTTQDKIWHGCEVGSTYIRKHGRRWLGHAI